jgi:predicted MPP superfamily phosphohydrolase
MTDYGAARRAELRRPKREPKRFLFRLETTLAEFENTRSEFLASLAKSLDIENDQITIVDVKVGCVKVTLDLREDTPLDAILAVLAVGRGTYSYSRLRATWRRFHVVSATPIDKKTDVPAVARAVGVHEELMTEGRRLTWLHFSDLHARSPGDGKGMYQNEIAKQLLNDLPDLLGDWNLEPDIVFFSGDLAFSGREDEYKSVREFLDTLYEQLPTRPRLFMVPGNHDVDWDYVDESADDQLDMELKTNEAVYRFLNAEDDVRARRRLSLMRLDNFFSFLRSCADLNHVTPPPEKFYWPHTFDHHGFSIGVAAINSAWRSTKQLPGSGRTDWRRLLLGGAQLSYLGEELAEADLRIALMHHPPDTEWFKGFDRQAQRSKMQEFDFVLRGHEHAPDAIGVRAGTTDHEWVHLPAGALYSKDEYPNSINAVTLNLDSARGMAFFWRYYQEHFRWRPDVGLLLDGQWIFDLPLDLRQRLEESAERDAGAAKVAAKAGAGGR